MGRNILLIAGKNKESPVTVMRIVPNIAADRVDDARSFYGDVLGMTIAMDFGWIKTFVADSVASPQVSVACEGGSGAPVPDLSVEVDNLEAVYARAVARGFMIEYGPADEPWGVRRFIVRDPFGRLVNILAHGG